MFGLVPFEVLYNTARRLRSRATCWGESVYDEAVAFTQSMTAAHANGNRE